MIHANKEWRERIINMKQLLASIVTLLLASLVGNGSLGSVGDQNKHVEKSFKNGH